MRTAHFHDKLAELTEPRSRFPGVETRDAVESFFREHAGTLYHPVMTCAMGNADMAVVDDKLRVHGVAGLRVVDASVMPHITRGNTNAPTIAIGEKAADLIMDEAATRVADRATG